DIRCGVAGAAGGAGRRAERARTGVLGGGRAGPVLRPPAARLDRGGTAGRAGHDRPSGRPAAARIRGRAPLPRHGAAGRVRLAGLVAAKRGQAERARGLLARALAGGADSAETRAALATLAARDKRWREAAALARAAFTGAPGTLRHPYPRAWLGEALTGVVQAGPAEAADSLLADAVRGRPGWSTLHELRAFAALRVGRCDVAVKEFLLLLDFGIERDDGPDLVMRCRRGLKLSAQ